ncbi:MAG: methyltransferase domain-containing protein [Ruminococcus sp.]|nr:methyltransferase domain-containing protein [Ruminococcus sp.]
MSENFFELFRRYKRYARYTFQYLFLEKPFGLDFSMRDTHLIDETNGEMHGYAKTDEAHIKQIFNELKIDSSAKIIDIGCGKGLFLKYACKKNFGAIAGIEYDKHTFDICKRNFERMKLQKRVKLYNGDASKFLHYGDYNIFYLANPFGAEIMDKVMDKIVASHKGKIYVILYNPTTADVIEAHGAKKIKELFDKSKSYWTYIYEIE